MTVRIGIADAEDPRVLDAARVLRSDGHVEPVLVVRTGHYLADDMAPFGADGGEAPLETLAQMVRDGFVGAGVAGSLSASAHVIRAGIKGLPRRGLATGCFAIVVDGRTSTYADCSVVPVPDAVQLSMIAEVAADHHRTMFGEEPRLAMLSFSTAGSAQHPDIDKVREATRLLRERRPDLQVDGEMQFDVAVDMEVGQRKMPGSPVAGRANVLIFPTLEAGNIAYKVAERIGGARALGSFVLNLARPWVDLSRGCTTDDIVETVRLVAAQITDQYLTEDIA